MNIGIKPNVLLMLFTTTTAATYLFSFSARFNKGGGGEYGH